MKNEYVGNKLQIKSLGSSCIEILKSAVLQDQCVLTCLMEIRRQGEDREGNE